MKTDPNVTRREFLQHSAAGLFLASGFASRLASGAATSPNFILIITDDVGYGDIGSYGAPDIRTPNIDSLARDGVKLTDFYANASTCSPTRAALVTGRYQQRFAIDSPLQHEALAAEQGLPVSGRSLPQLLKNTGYATALMGKWHLGYKPEYSPNAHGFDYFFGFKSGYIDYYQHTDGGGHHDLFENLKPVVEDGYMTDLITARSIRFIEQNVSRPFFLEVAYNAAHWPYQRPDHPSIAMNNARHVQPGEFPASTRQDYVAVLERADQGIGQILRRLDDLNLARNTIVIFTNDNGGEWLSSNAPLFHRKFTLWEGGIRVPTLLRWPGVLPAGQVSSQVGMTMDLSASLLAAANATIPPETRLDGIDLLPILRGQSSMVERTLFWRTTAGGRRQRAVRRGDFKLMIDANATMLFDVHNDVGERLDLTTSRQELVGEFSSALRAWENDVDAEARANGTITINSPTPPRPAGAPPAN